MDVLIKQLPELLATWSQNLAIIFMQETQRIARFWYKHCENWTVFLHKKICIIICSIQNNRSASKFQGKPSYFSQDQNGLIRPLEIITHNITTENNRENTPCVLLYPGDVGTLLQQADTIVVNSTTCPSYINQLCMLSSLMMSNYIL